MSELLGTFGQFGLLGCIVAVLIYDVFVLQKKLMDVLDQNTKAFVDLKNVIDRLENKNE
jgi:hypothetical protein